MLNNLLLKSVFLAFILSVPMLQANDDMHHTTVQVVDDLDALFKQSKLENKVVLLEMSASYCSFCRTLEAEIINPMIISGEYDHVLIRHIEIDSYDDIKMPNGVTMTPSEFASSKNVFVTPTLLFLNGDNEEIAKRILGVNSVEYFGGFVDEALKKAAESMQ